MKPKELLEKYFDGETTCEEERLLRHLFATHQIPEDLEVYRSFFAGIDHEVEAFRQSRKNQTWHLAKAQNKLIEKYLHHMLYLTTGVAATLLLCIGIFTLLPDNPQRTTDYAIINGAYCNDPQIVHVKAIEALENVSFSEKELKDNIIPNLLH